MRGNVLVDLDIRVAPDVLANVLMDGDEVEGAVNPYAKCFCPSVPLLVPVFVSPSILGDFAAKEEIVAELARELVEVNSGR